MLIRVHLLLQQTHAQMKFFFPLPSMGNVERKEPRGCEENGVDLLVAPC